MVISEKYIFQEQDFDQLLPAAIKQPLVDSIEDTTKTMQVDKENYSESLSKSFYL